MKNTEFFLLWLHNGEMDDYINVEKNLGGGIKNENQGCDDEKSGYSGQ
jgi:hypothetical protein